MLLCSSAQHNPDQSAAACLCVLYLSHQMLSQHHHRRPGVTALWSASFLIASAQSAAFCIHTTHITHLAAFCRRLLCLLCCKMSLQVPSCLWSLLQPLQKLNAIAALASSSSAQVQIKCAVQESSALYDCNLLALYCTMQFLCACSHCV